MCSVQLCGGFKGCLLFTPAICSELGKSLKLVSQAKRIASKNALYNITEYFTINYVYKLLGPQNVPVSAPARTEGGREAMQAAQSVLIVASSMLKAAQTVALSSAVSAVWAAVAALSAVAAALRVVVAALRAVVAALRTIVAYLRVVVVAQWPRGCLNFRMCTSPSVPSCCRASLFAGGMVN